MIAVLHDLALAARFCSRVLLIDDGTVVGDSRPEQALSAAAVRRQLRVEPLDHVARRRACDRAVATSPL